MNARDTWTHQHAAPLADALAEWLPRQRWSGAAGRRVSGIRFVRAVRIVDHSRYGGPIGVLAIVSVTLATAADQPSENVHYQVLLGMRPGKTTAARWRVPVSVMIVQLDRWAVYDGTADPELMSALLGLIAGGVTLGDVRFVAERSEPLCLADRAGLAVRVSVGEQSNTSIVFGRRFILKVFRRLTVGINPELEIHRGLAGNPDPHMAELLGAIEGELDNGPVTLGVLHSFAPDAVDGWALATSALRAHVNAGASPAGSGAPASDREFDEAISGLGAAVATMHGRLAVSFGSAKIDDPRGGALRIDLLGRLEANAREAPVLLPHLPALRALIGAALIDPAEHVQRVHGDLHLGQVLRTSSGWLLIDFEGEPAAPIEQRVRWRSPLWDIAGMLRSLDYAAGHAAIMHGAPRDLVDQWATVARASFWRGYTEAAATVGMDRADLLRIHELDKAAYEVVYELHNRPGWLEIPLRAVRRLAATIEPTFGNAGNTDST